MTLGEKIKKARKEAGMSQEQLAEKLLVSRSAIAKWETDKGLPDVQNLKSISSVLGITVDYLLDEDNPISMNTIREAINPADHSGTRNGCWQNSLVLSKFPEAAAVYNLLKKRSSASLNGSLISLLHRACCMLLITSTTIRCII